MNKVAKRAFIALPFCLLFIIGLSILAYSFFANGSLWSANRANKHIFSGGSLISAGKIYDKNGAVLAETKGSERIYSDNSTIRKATLHTVGDVSGFISTGIHSIYRLELSGYSFVNGVYLLKEYGKGSDLHLTIDEKLCKTAYNALGSYKGTVGVYNYKTGELVCSVSTPSYDPKNKPKDIDTEKGDKYEGIYLDRLLSGLYTPGSIFKTITAVCAIENISDLKERTFTCKGKYETGDGIVICNDTHGKLNFEKAFSHSCNSVFAQLAIELGSEKLNETAAALGFSRPVFIDKVIASTSRMDITGKTKTELGWAGIGQFTTLINPLQMLTLMGAIANGGAGFSPHCVESIVSPSGAKTFQYKLNTNEPYINMNPSTAKELKRLMRNNVISHYGESRFKNLEMCGKTGTAEVDDKKPNSCFTGFSQREDMPYAVIVIAENAGSGNGVAMTIANKVLQEMR